ncbi:5-formyltetrahydrofolate cyclo-ligase [Moraxella boevrei]|uniref:5-formyltetrahydrofolate cyclo-ligase n=1 Tax=Faucicola boevrei TaxID=346665 RepID=UPI0037359BD7
MPQKHLRKQLRKQRLAFTKRERNYHALQAYRQLSKLNKYKHGTKVGLFLDAFGELPTQPIADWAKRHGFELYLPVVIHADKVLKFIKISQYTLKNNRLITHKLGMQQPAYGNMISAKQLDLLFMPLVALDKKGNRMGMGGGFYDKTLAKCKNKPVKIGWAYNFQLVERLDVNTWDIGLDMAILPSQKLRFRRYLNP